MIWFYSLVALIIFFSIFRIIVSSKKPTNKKSQDIDSIHNNIKTESELITDNMSPQYQDKNLGNPKALDNVEKTKKTVESIEHTENSYVSELIETANENENSDDNWNNQEDQESQNIDDQLHRILYNFSEDEQNDFCVALKKHSLYKQQEFVNQLERLNLSLLHDLYIGYKSKTNAYRNKNFSYEAPLYSMNLGKTVIDNAYERYRDNDYFGTSNRYSSPKWEEDRDDYEQCGFCEKF